MSRFGLISVTIRTLLVPYRQPRQRLLATGLFELRYSTGDVGNKKLGAIFGLAQQGEGVVSNRFNLSLEVWILLPKGRLDPDHIFEQISWIEVSRHKGVRA